MFIKDLQARQTGVEVEGVVLEVSDPREFNKSGQSGKVANAIIKDYTGTVKLSLWNEQIEKVSIGAKVRVEKGYVSEWQGELQLTTGKFGSLEILDASENTPRIEEKPPEDIKKEPESDFEVTKEDAF